VSDNGLGYYFKKQFRVLELDALGIYTQTVYDQTEREIIEGPYQPTDYDGNTWDEIPFEFIGAENNDSYLDPIPLYDIAIINLAHYRDSCDVQESSFYCSQPTTFVHTNSAAFVDAYGKVNLGSRQLYVTTENSRAEMLQASPNNLARELMKDKEKQIAAIGARIIAESNTGRETAQGARIRFASANSALFTLTSNAELAVTAAVERICRFQGADPSQVIFQLNSQFYEEEADPNLIAQQILLMGQSVITKDDIRDYLRKTNLLQEARTNEILDNEGVTAPVPQAMNIDNNLKQQQPFEVDNGIQY
jgi:hypothetical protein